MLCQAFGCNLHAPLQCTKCRDLGMSSSLGRYCSRDCQKNDFARHRAIHNLADNSNSKLTPSEFVATICMSLLDLRFRSTLAIDTNLSVVSIAFLGASETYELNQDFKELFRALRKYVYPSLSQLNITFCGPSINPNQEPEEMMIDLLVKPSSSVVALSADLKSEVGHISGGKGRICLNFVPKGFDDAYPDPSQFVSLFSTFFLITPGFIVWLSPLGSVAPSLYDSWAPTVRLLMKGKVAVVVTSYSRPDMISDDALFDEDILRRYYGAKIIIPTTKNPRMVDGYCGDRSKNAYYLAFQGFEEPAPPVLLNRGQYKRYLVCRHLLVESDGYKAAGQDKQSRACVQAVEIIDPRKTTTTTATALGRQANEATTTDMTQRDTNRSEDDTKTEGLWSDYEIESISGADVMRLVGSCLTRLECDGDS